MEIIEAVDLAERDKELRAVGVGAAVGHGEHARGVVPQAGHKLVGKTVAGIALAGAERVAALHDKIRHDPVKLKAVEKGLARLRTERALGEADEVGHGERRFLVKQFRGDRAAGRDDFRIKSVGEFFHGARRGGGLVPGTERPTGGEQGKEREQGSHGGHGERIKAGSQRNSRQVTTPSRVKNLVSRGGAI